MSTITGGGGGSGVGEFWWHATNFGFLGVWSGIPVQNAVEVFLCMAIGLDKSVPSG